MVNGIHDDKQIRNANKLVAPSLQGTWKAEDLWATGYLDAYSTSISVMAMEQCVQILAACFLLVGLDNDPCL